MAVDSLNVRQTVVADTEHTEPHGICPATDRGCSLVFMYFQMPSLIHPGLTPKAMRIGQRFKQMLNKHGGKDVMVKEMVEKLMKDRVKAEKSKLPGICAVDWEYNHNPIFVEVGTPRGLCGTRSTAALTIRAGSIGLQ
ncbi:Tetratricopeptide repeat-like superfamily protein [Hibiscus syriacus]|uniref:Tetratricopeptide repeat-like superfamily protein n=1 Tax=Hibiscus syriacus TaxID=106335 RepID=A0A6A3D2J7_HIBSY|nr:Tetratricopeptide repeat-like superfamily protein [Hibiscus syriacus]